MGSAASNGIANQPPGQLTDRVNMLVAHNGRAASQQTSARPALRHRYGTAALLAFGRMRGLEGEKSRQG
jgi:hypothetical protein